MAITLRKATDPNPLTKGTRITHVGYGLGVVIASESHGKVTVRFDRQGLLFTQGGGVILPSWQVTATA